MIRGSFQVRFNHLIKTPSVNILKFEIHASLANQGMYKIHYLQSQLTKKRMKTDTILFILYVHPS